MTVFSCAACGTELTPDLRELPGVPDVRGHDGRGAPSTVPRGRYAVDPEPWGAPFTAPGTAAASVPTDRAPLMPPGMTDMVPTGPRNSVIVHPEDVPGLRLSGSLGIHRGCCGPLGTGGPNMACACGTRVATLAADCMGPHELRLDPVRTHASSPGPSA
ncbi:hypothetical protein WDV06_05405 [Streptomyces racemochromogenes]|uniref:Uncharacterized protein n=1 Tax=Streptomyces racemochromogenes TaxID=67353 RepID=A0ABW7P855_9ACTN